MSNRRDVWAQKFSVNLRFCAKLEAIFCMISSRFCIIATVPREKRGKTSERARLLKKTSWETKQLHSSHKQTRSSWCLGLNSTNRSFPILVAAISASVDLWLQMTKMMMMMLMNAKNMALHNKQTVRLADWNESFLFCFCWYYVGGDRSLYCFCIQVGSVRFFFLFSSQFFNHH